MRPTKASALSHRGSRKSLGIPYIGSFGIPDSGSFGIPYSGSFAIWRSGSLFCTASTYRGADPALSSIASAI